MSIRGLSLFCEDIRQEKTGQECLIGTLPDIVAVPHTAEGQAAVVKICIYTKVYFSSDEEPEAFQIRTIDSAGTVIGTAYVSRELVERAYAVRGETPFYGLKNSTSLVLTGKQAPAFIRVEVIRDENCFETGTLYFKHEAPTQQSSVEPPLTKRAGRRAKAKLMSSGAATAAPIKGR